MIKVDLMGDKKVINSAHKVTTTIALVNRKR